jgi:hypothetical protein
MSCEDILKLIRASKTYNLKHIKIGDLEIVRNVGDDEPVVKLELAPEVSEADTDDEVQEYVDENLMISDPVEYEKRMMGEK